MQYQTSASPLLLRNVPSLILEEDSTESLVGEQLLLDLGFDPQQLLADACVESNDRDCSHVPSAMIHGGGRLISRVMLQRDSAGPFMHTPLVDLHNLSDVFLFDVNLCNISDPSDFSTEDDVDYNSKLMENDFAVDIGPGNDADTLTALSDLLDTAKTNGISDDGVVKLDAPLVEFRDIWRLRLGNDPPADVPPIEIQMKPDVGPLIAKVRRYAPTHRAFISAQVAKMEDQGIIYRNQSSDRASAPHIVSKPKAGSFRFTLDYKRETTPKSRRNGLCHT
jgi:hypothetical protein